MTVRLLTSGDIVRIPQGVKMITWENVHEWYTGQELYGIYKERVDHEKVEIIIDNRSWIINEDDVYRGDANAN